MASKTRTVEIEHKDGRVLAVTEYDFANKKVTEDGKTYADLGFKIARWGDLSAYEEPEAPVVASVPATPKGT